MIVKRKRILVKSEKAAEALTLVVLVFILVVGQSGGGKGCCPCVLFRATNPSPPTVSNGSSRQWRANAVYGRLMRGGVKSSTSYDLHILERASLCFPVVTDLLLLLLCYHRASIRESMFLVLQHNRQTSIYTSFFFFKPSFSLQENSL